MKNKEYLIEKYLVKDVGPLVPLSSEEFARQVEQHMKANKPISSPWDPSYMDVCVTM